MSGTIDWSKVGEGSKKSSKNRSMFMRLQAGTYQVRPLGAPVMFHKFVVKGEDNRYQSAVVNDPKDNPATKNHNLDPTERYAINVLDRADGELKILEAGITVFGEFKKYWEHTQKNPGARDGADFRIVIEGSFRTKKYTTSFAKKSVLTDEEVTMIKERGGLHDLEKVFKPTPDDELEAKLFGEAAKENSNEQTVTAQDTSVDAGLGLNTVTPSGDIAADAKETGDDLPF